MRDFNGLFWTRYDELLDAVEGMGYTVEYATDEYIIVTDEEENEYTLYLGWAGSTMWIKEVRAA